MRLHVEVTRRDIAAGRKRACDACPIALALLRCDGISEVWVDDQISVRTRESPFLPFTASIPPLVQEFVDRFDAGEDDLCPLTFDVDVEVDVDSDESRMGGAPA